MYKTIKDFTTEWGYESQSTIKVFKKLTTESLHQKVTNDGRSLGFIAWHICLTMGEMLGRTGLIVDVPKEHTPMPLTAEEIIATYEKGAKSVQQLIESKWADQDLPEMVHMYGEEWSKATILNVLIKHQGHHRGQMTILMRQAGLVVPGVYGPAKEEWAEWGMPTME